MKPHDANDGVLAPASDLHPHIDLLSDILKFVQLSGERVLATELRSGFNIEFQRGSACIHVVQDGELRICVEGRAPLELSAGDIVVLPHPARYRLSDGSRPDAAMEAPLEIATSDAHVPVLAHGRGAVAARTISATFRFDSKGGVAPLLGDRKSVV